MTLEEAAALASALPEVSEGLRYGNRTWFLGGKAFAWERPFSKADVRRYGDRTPPDGPILAISVADLGEKAAVLAANPGGFFDIPHFDGFAAVLVQLSKASKKSVREALLDGWLSCAPEPLVRKHFPDGAWLTSSPAIGSRFLPSLAGASLRPLRGPGRARLDRRPPAGRCP